MLELNADDLKYFSEFEKVTKVSPNDYLISENTIAFLVDREALGKAIGKQGTNIRRLGEVFRKRVVILSDSDDYEVFIKNVFYNITVLTTEMREAMGQKALFITIEDKDRGMAIGKGGERIKMIKAFVKKKFNADLSLRTKRTF